ncbi:MAG: hypothetical protein AAGE52_16000 [Myxococcota bacterium]
MTNWVLALDGYCRSLGVDGRMDGDDVILEVNGERARATMSNEGLTIRYER